MSDRKNEGFYRKDSGSRNSLAKEREEYFDPETRILPCRLLPLPVGVGAGWGWDWRHPAPNQA